MYPWWLSLSIRVGDRAVLHLLIRGDTFAARRSNLTRSSRREDTKNAQIHKISYSSPPRGHSTSLCVLSSNGVANLCDARAEPVRCGSHTTAKCTSGAPDLYTKQRRATTNALGDRRASIMVTKGARKNQTWDAATHLRGVHGIRHAAPL